jgi:hypothetical protein
MDLREKVELVFADELRQYQAKGLVGAQITLGSLNVGPSFPSGLLAEQSTPNFVASPNAERLLKLHAMLDQADRKKFTDHLFFQMNVGLFTGEISYLSFLVLHRLGRTTDAIQAARNRHSIVSRPGRGSRDFKTFFNVLAVLSGVVATEYGQLSGRWCEAVRAALGDNIGVNRVLRDRLNCVLLLHLDVELADANPEIFADRDRVLSIWEKHFGDRHMMSELVNDIDQYFRDGERSETALATCADRIRVLLGTVCKAIADQCVAHGRKPPPPNANEQAIFQHLQGIGLITKPEWAILNALHRVASDVGSHAIVASIEDTRLTKNMAYEMLLLLLTRMQTHSRSQL